MNLSWSVTRSTSRLQFHRVFLSLCFKCIPFFLIIFFNLSFIFNTEGTQEPRYIECKCVICDGGCAGGGQRDSYHLLGFLTNLPHRPLFKTISDGAAIGRQPIAFATLTGTMRNTGKKRERERALRFCSLPTVLLWWSHFTKDDDVFFWFQWVL